MKEKESALIAGGSLLNTNILEISRKIDTIRNVSIQISNYSYKYILAKPRVFTSSGYCLDPPQPTVQRRTTEACSFTKTTGVPRGAVGVLTYEIQNPESRRRVGELVIMFSVPFDYIWYENWFTLGIYKEAVSCNYGLFHQMYHEKGLFTRAKGTGVEIQFKGEHVHVKGTMSPASQSIMKVELWDAK